MIILNFLQQNAEWMCSIAIVIFTAVQCWLVHQQNVQNLKLKRLELANNLDNVAAIFLGEIEQASQVRQWLVANATNFAFLLNKKDIVKYKEVCYFILQYLYRQNLTVDDKQYAIKQFLNLVGELDTVLGNANYGFVKVDNELKKGVSNDR